MLVVNSNCTAASPVTMDHDFLSAGSTPSTAAECLTCTPVSIYLLAYRLAVRQQQQRLCIAFDHHEQFCLALFGLVWAHLVLSCPSLSKARSVSRCVAARWVA